MALMHALWALTTPFAPCSAYATSNELVHCLRITNASTIFCHANRLKATLEAAKTVGIPTSKIYILDGRASRGLKSISQAILSASFPRELPSKAVPVKKDQLAFVFFSSGTTGLPKGDHSSPFNYLADCVVSCCYLARQHPSPYLSAPRMAAESVAIRISMRVYTCIG